MQNKLINQTTTRPPSPNSPSYNLLLKQHRALMLQLKHREPTEAEHKLLAIFLAAEEAHALREMESR